MADTPFVARLREALEADDLAPSTRVVTARQAGQFELWLRGTTGEGIDPDGVRIASVDLMEYRGALQRKGTTPASVQRHFASIRKALLLLAPELALRLKWPKLPTQQPQAPSELGRNLRNAILRAAELMSPRDGCIVTMLLFTGCRASTLADARVSMLRLAERSGEITYHAKGNRTYSVPLNSACRTAIRTYLETRPAVEHDRLLVSERFPFGPVSRGVIWAVWHERMRSLLPKHLQDRIRGPHQARHDLCRRLVSGELGADLGVDARRGGRGRAPVPLADAAAIMGHADVRCTASIYSRPAPEDLKRALEGLVGDGEEE